MAFGVHPAGGTGHPVMPSPYPTITHAAGTNALTFAASLDRAGTVFYVVATQLPVHTNKTALAVLSIYPATILMVWLLENLAGIS